MLLVRGPIEPISKIRLLATRGDAQHKRKKSLRDASRADTIGLGRAELVSGKMFQQSLFVRVGRESCATKCQCMRLVT